MYTCTHVQVHRGLPRHGQVGGVGRGVRGHRQHRREEAHWLAGGRQDLHHQGRRRHRGGEELAVGCDTQGSVRTTS